MRWLKKKVGVFYASLLLDKTASTKLMFRVGTVEVALDHHVRLKSKIYHSHCKSALTTAEAVKISTLYELCLLLDSNGCFCSVSRPRLGFSPSPMSPRAC